MNQLPRKLSPAQAAKILGSNTESVRIRMQRNLFDPPIGTACKLSGIRYAYEVYPERLATYLNISLDELFRRLEE